MDEKQEICLVMIVRNESRNIVRCLDSTLPLIKHLFVIDTLSTDTTVPTIEQFCTERGLSHHIHEEAFINFGFTRTRAFQLAVRRFPSTSYILLLDADMELIIDSVPKLEHKEYHLEQFSQYGSYWNTRLLSAKHWFECCGVTHEYWSTGECNRLYGLKIKDYEDGGCKEDKYTRDRQLLERELGREDLPSPMRERYTFYYAQTLRSLGDQAGAIKQYQKRYEMGGYDQEQFYALYQIGNCYQTLAADSKDNLSLVKSAIYAYSVAFNFRNIRAEPLAQAIKLFIAMDNKETVTQLLEMLIKLQPSTDMLFNDTQLIGFEVYFTAMDYYDKLRDCDMVEKCKQAIKRGYYQPNDYYRELIKDRII